MKIIVLKKSALTIYIVLICVQVFSQNTKQNSKIMDEHVNAVLIKGSYSLQIPFLDYAERYGLSSSIGGNLSVKFGKNFIIGADGNFIFGQKFNDVDLFTGIDNDQGQISGWNGLYEPYVVNQRGFTVKGEFGKVFNFGKRLNKNTGFLATIGFGAFQNRIKLELSESNAPHLDDEMKKGYDRLTNGFLCSQFIGFQYLDTRRRINFFIGWEFNQAYTKNRRSWDYNKNEQPSQELRKDFSSGFKLGWIIPIYLIETQKYYTY